MSYKSPFTITSDILNLVAETNEQVGGLNASALNVSPQLHKQNRIKTITGTLAIEGNSLSEEQITLMVDGPRVLGSVCELAEVKGAIVAYDALPKLQTVIFNLAASSIGLNGRFNPLATANYRPPF